MQNRLISSATAGLERFPQPANPDLPPGKMMLPDTSIAGPSADDWTGTADWLLSVALVLVLVLHGYWLGRLGRQLRRQTWILKRLARHAVELNLPKPASWRMPPAPEEGPQHTPPPDAPPEPSSPPLSPVASPLAAATGIGPESGVEPDSAPALLEEPAVAAGIRIVVARDLLPRIHDYVVEFLETHGADCEAGGLLLGHFLPAQASAPAVIRIEGYIDAGPTAEATAASIQFDNQYQAGVLQCLQLTDQALGNMGCFHRHPGQMSECSAGDQAADRQAVAESDTRALVFLILTLDNPDRHRPARLVYRRLAFDFYIMSEDAGFRYVPVRPELADLPVVTVPAGLRALVTLRPQTAVYDLAVLHQLARTWRSRIELAAREDTGVVATMRGNGDCCEIQAPASGGMQVTVTRGDQPRRRVRGIWEDRQASRHIWLSHVFLVTLAPALPRASVGSYSPHYADLLHDPRRLAIETQAMAERAGRGAILRAKGGQVYWECTIRECGREFPIRIIYPPGYPSVPPRIESVYPLPACPHALGLHELCWISPITTASDWNPARDTAAVCVNAAHRWFACLLIYRTAGRWPGNHT
ncbi:MAG TPA: hypothetical protein P5555_07355 [Candidatus Paceibacterota bacterium]|nr:hypothetical protein [Verrucomicrobiota bacterium]HRZ44993.1 hypothetical protein [Candidatus Paceibacterota bacterium]HRZ99351.1 hypothetical protein [Candidatus Paceibacterota bacterium]